MKKTVAIIQARIGSTRLPFKMMLSLHGKPIIEWVLKRVERSKLIDEIIVAIPLGEDNDILQKYINELGFNVFRGSENNVLSRFYESVKDKSATNIVRICADNPLIDAKEIDNLIKFYNTNKCDYAYNHIPKNNLYPDGLGAEILSFELLKWLNENVVLQHHKEHCLSYITDNEDKFCIKTFDPLDKTLHHPELRFDIDTFDDYHNLAMKDFDIDITSEELILLYIKNESFYSNDKKFENWNKLKQKIDKKDIAIGFREQDILVVSVGQNIGFETYGKKEEFLRPVLVFKKLGTYSFIGIPLTKTQRDGDYYYNFQYTKKIKSSAMLNQIKVFDIKRVKYKSGKIRKCDFDNIRSKFIKLLPHSKEGERTKAKIGTIVSDTTKNVKGKIK